MKKLNPFYYFFLIILILSVLLGLMSCGKPTKSTTQTIVLDSISKDKLTKNGLNKPLNTYFCENITVNNYTTEADIKDILFYHNVLIGILVLVVMLLVAVIYFKVILNINLKL